MPGAALSQDAAAFFSGGQAHGGAAAAESIEVMAANWLAVQVYMACQWTVLAGFAGMHAQGISAQEARAAMAIHRVPLARRQDLLRRVQIMAEAARPILNKSA